ncbi:MAG: sterol desaturase family protein [Cryomorphaceae bacterium]|jgi:sterol desaturase/sphingolipid hydroxylase (fatty acid hydroxylase superfamily)|nr:sterol desaturase family protein [Cryomorphaceae bacterium]MDG1889372.1 sterol desaturase family protein [Flavobacteriaceae bacterium]MBT3503824.1 sterol desaturase family protein [Cryomorphaceae bacterium]MBT3688890.1 sterol desaturase family protein [Cryomorphaceae bacterium]MBT4221654.1 sterol desaturase family protein [Cryomorphaceae bacterium]
MDTYANILLITIPIFSVLIIVEVLYGVWKKDQKHSYMDTISSLSSGFTNLMVDILGLGIIIFSYPFFYERLKIIELEESVLFYFIAFVCVDFASYCHHRLKHSINIFWNMHVIHHSSEEFNLACALRQSMTNNLGLGILFLIPAALLGVPPKMISILAPLHLFGQFWYHTRHIGKLGWLEYILVTPSQHRVHHAINKEYIDKNLAAIFCIWDRAFGTFQEELDDVPCVYGTLKPVNTWNPILINFQHLWYLIQDASHTNNLGDKLKLWFMPTGWRPKDVQGRFPRNTVEDVYSQEKYKPNYNLLHKIFIGFHFLVLEVILFTFLSSFADLTIFDKSAYLIFIFSTIFSFSSIMDGFKWSTSFEYVRIVIGIAVIAFQGDLQLTNNPSISIFLISYLVISFILNLLVQKSVPARIFQEIS